MPVRNGACDKVRIRKNEYFKESSHYLLDNTSMHITIRGNESLLRLSWQCYVEHLFSVRRQKDSDSEYLTSFQRTHLHCMKFHHRLIITICMLLRGLLLIKVDFQKHIFARTSVIIGLSMIIMYALAYLSFSTYPRSEMSYAGNVNLRYLSPLIRRNLRNSVQLDNEFHTNTAISLYLPDAGFLYTDYESLYRSTLLVEKDMQSKENLWSSNASDCTDIHMKKQTKLTGMLFNYEIVFRRWSHGTLREHSWTIIHIGSASIVLPKTMLFFPRIYCLSNMRI